MTKILAPSFAVIISALIGCAARQTPSIPKTQKGVVSFVIRDGADNQLVDELEFDAPVTVERGPCRASTDCLIWHQGTEKYQREMQPGWTVSYVFAASR